MPNTLKVAAIQLDSAPAPVPDRLSRAADLIAEAVSSGAQIVVLPELFNTGYRYDDQNYDLSEPMEGQTVTWMRTQARHHRIHIAGTLLLRDTEDIYNSALLISPDGQIWRYDKQFPFLWERAYFREGSRITVANTEFGKIGMMICWDSAHASVWDRYAGKVDAMLVMSCPPKLTNFHMVLPNGERLGTRDLGGVWQEMYTEEEHFPGTDMDEHAAWMGVPVIATAGGGKFESHLPLPEISVGAYLVNRPDLWNILPDARDVKIEAGYDLQTKVIDSTGKVVARVGEQGDGYTLAEISLPESTPKPVGSQPPMRTPPVALLAADIGNQPLLIQMYRQKVRDRLGESMAPVDTRTKVWAAVALGVGMLGWLLAKITRAHRS
jgi:predicted amidohydrolase